MSQKFKLAIIVGHLKVVPGAHGCAPLDQFEYDYNCGLALMMKGYALGHGCETKVFLRDQIGLRACYNQVNEYSPHAAIELHFNAANRQARGTETLFGDKNAKSEKLAHFIQNAMCKVFERDVNTNRGVKHLAEKDRGYTNVNIARCPSCLIEPFFGDQVDDATLGVNKKEALALCLVESMIDFLLSETT
jgi:N-acetylmuramoyl-L-alanine amidase